MRSTFSILPYINRSKVKADGTTAVLLPHHHRRQEFHDGNGHLLQAGGLEQQDGRNPHRQREQPLAGVPQIR